jgi:hypothetical protein
LWDKGTFAKAYKENRTSLTAEVVENDPVASAVRTLIMEHVSRHWVGTATELLHQLELVIGEKASKAKRWPDGPAALGRRIKRIATPLRRLGIEVRGEREGHERERRITITRGENVRKMPSAPSAPSAPPGGVGSKPLIDNDFSNADSADSKDSNLQTTTSADSNRRHFQYRTNKAMQEQRVRDAERRVAHRRADFKPIARRRFSHFKDQDK